MDIYTFELQLAGLPAESSETKPGLIVVHNPDYDFQIESRRAVLDAGGAILFVHGVRQPRPLRETDLPDHLQKYFPRVHAFTESYISEWDRVLAYLNRAKVINLGADMQWHTLYPESLVTPVSEGGIDYEDKFDDLWRFDQELKGRMILKGARAPGRVNVGVIGSVGGIRLDEYLSAYDWAVIAMLRTARPRQPARIVILDDKGESPGRKRFEDFKHVLEQVIQVNGEPDSAAAEWSLSPSERDLLRRNWSMNVCEPAGDHHAIYNLVGAELLVGSMDPKYTPKVPALKELLRTLGLVPPQSQTELPWHSLPANVEQVVLIDDLAGFGWEQFLKKALGTELVHSIEVVGDEILEKADWALRNRVRLSFTGVPKELVFLDLRLFATLGVSKEREFLKKVEGVIGRLELPWQEDLKLAAKFINGAPRESNEYHVALTLLPRLLAAADPTLPIILFSSTGRNSILKRFDGFPNLVARHFEKPQFNGSSVEDMAIETQSKFVHAMQRAERLVKGRSVCIDLPSTGLNLNDDAHCCADIFIDECGTQNGERDRYFAVGGLLLLSTQRNTVRNIDSVLRDAPEIDGTRKMVWGISEKVGPYELADPIPAGNDHLPKEPAVSKAEILLLPIAGLLESNNIDVYAFTLYEAFDAPSKRGPEFQKNHRQDNRYRYLLTETLQALLFSMLADRNLKEIRIHVATRLAHAAGDRLARMKHDFGYREGPMNLVYSFSGADVLPLVLQLCSDHESWPDITQARGVTLTNFENLRKKKWSREVLIKQHLPRPLQIHYLADWLVRFAHEFAEHNCDDKQIPGAAKAWFDRGFLQERTDAWKAWLKASKEACLNDFPAAIASAEKASHLEIPPSRGIHRWIRPRITGWVNELDGKSFDRLCDLIA